MNIGPCQRHPTDNTVYLRLAVVAPNLGNSPKIRTYSYSRLGSSKVIDLGAYRKHSHYKY